MGATQKEKNLLPKEHIFYSLTLLHSERGKVSEVLAGLSAKGLRDDQS